MSILMFSMVFNCILLFCLLAPNIVMLIHSKFFEWKVEPEVRDKALMFSILQMLSMEHCSKMTHKDLKDWFVKTVKFLFIPLVFWSCAKKEPENLVSKEEAIYQVSDIDLPKHASVTLTNMTTKMVFKDVYLGKHCSDLHFWSEGDMVTLSRYSYQQGSVITEDFSYGELKTKFCQ